jgi:hypothetical protein
MSSQELTTTTANKPAELANKPPPQPRISAKLRKALLFLEDGTCATQRAAALRAGCTESQLSRQLQTPQIQAFLAQRRALNIARGTLRASARIGNLVDAESEHVSLHASRLLLETSGDLKSSAGGVNVSINNTVQAGYVIDLSESERSEKAARVVDGDTQTVEQTVESK